MPEPLKYPAILRAVYGTPWAIRPEKLVEIRAFLRLKAEGAEVPPEEIAARVRSSSGVQMAGRVAVLPLFGILARRMGMIEEASGGTSTEQFGAALDQLLADKGVKAVVIVADSPGGSVFGVEELARKVYDARGDKKIVGLADPMAASAAYWVLSQAAEVNVTPSGQVGSIGVLAAHEDVSAMLEEAGVKVSLISAGKYKTEGNEYEPLGEEARAALQAEVNRYYGMFAAAVARGRGVTEAAVRNGFGQGRMVGAREAVAAGMADRVATLEQVLARLGAPSAAGAAAESAAGKVYAAATDGPWLPGTDLLRRRLRLADPERPG